VTGIEALKGTGKTKYEPVAGGGSLVARGLTAKVRYYYQYWEGGRKARCPFGDHSKDGDSDGGANSTKYTLAGARSRAVTLAAIQKEQGDLIGYLADQREAAEETIQSNREARVERKKDARKYSLEKLCKAYSDHLTSQDKASASTVRNALTLWVVKRHPELAATKASDITTEDVLTILRSVIDAGHTTMTNRLRSYLSAAYTFGIGSATDPLTNSEAEGFRLTANPIVAVKPVQRFEVHGERALSIPELAELITRLEGLETPPAMAVLLALRLGGQRITQLLNVTPERYDSDSNTVTLVDSKGRRTKPRLHVLPVVDAALPILNDALSAQHPQRTGLWNGLTLDTVSKEVAIISRGMTADGMAEPFTLRDLRRTCETRLAAMGISKDLRAQLQSHGLSGVQAKHYDKHDYLDEKRQALEAWNVRLDELLTGSEHHGNVVQLEQTIG